MNDIKKWNYEAKKLAKEVLRRGILWSGSHGCHDESGSDEERREFSKLLPYAEVLKKYPCIEMDTDIFIPIDIERRIGEFLGFRPSKKFYLTNHEHLKKHGGT
jgi:hypothetical protein